VGTKVAPQLRPEVRAEKGQVAVKSGPMGANEAKGLALTEFTANSEKNSEFRNSGG